MPTSVTMPALGESVTEGTVTRWLKQEGEQVEVDEPLLEVSTDKVDTEIPSPAAGTLTKILVSEDEPSRRPPSRRPSPPRSSPLPRPPRRPPAAGPAAQAGTAASACR